MLFADAQTLRPVTTNQSRPEGRGFNPIILMKKELFEELKQSLREANLIKRGQMKPGRVLHVNPESNIVLVRGKLGMSQSKFAAILGISADTLQNWERGGGSPPGRRRCCSRLRRRILRFCWRWRSRVTRTANDANS